MGMSDSHWQASEDARTCCQLQSHDSAGIAHRSKSARPRRLRFNDKKPCRLYYRMGQGNIIGEIPLQCMTGGASGGGGDSDSRARQLHACTALPSWDQDKEIQSHQD